MTTEPQSISAQDSLPVWAKFLLGLFVSGVILAVLLLTVGVYMLAEFQKSATDPKNILQTLAKIADFETPLPAGFVPYAAGTIANMTSAGIKHEGDDQLFGFISQPSGGHTAPKILETEKTALAERKMDFEVTKRGTMLVAGESMVYILGDMKPDSLQQGQQLLGVLVPKGSADAIIVSVSNRKQVDLPETQKLLDAIKGFRHAKQDGSTSKPGDQKDHAN